MLGGQPPGAATMSENKPSNQAGKASDRVAVPGTGATGTDASAPDSHATGAAARIAVATGVAATGAPAGSDSATGAPGTADPAAADPAPGVSWFRALTRLWLLRRVDAEPRGNPHVLLVLLALTWIAAWMFIDRWQRQPDPEFYVDGIPLLGWYALAVLGLAQWLKWISSPGPTLPAMLFLTLGMVPLPLLMVSVASYYLPAPWFWVAGVAVAVYLLVFLLRGLRALTGRSQPKAALTGLLCVVAFMWSSNAVNAIPDVWNPRDAGTAISDEELATREAALFEQSDRIDTALETVQRDASPNPEGFFLGFAGVGDEKVFAQEIGLASRVLGERFGIGDRHLSLVNDERDLERAPLASVSGLAYALHGMASRMDLNKDVLFLAISSHGSQDPAIAVSNSQFPFTDLSAEDLHDALRDAGIKWRVIIISACYAGGFIDSLRDPQTIVITAAASDRTSFGCSSDSDLTYFGEAFYRDALPEARSLRDAFEMAKKAIAVREHDEQVTPSNPQAYFGAELESKLDAMNGRGKEARPAPLSTRSVRRPGTARIGESRPTSFGPSSLRHAVISSLAHESRRSPIACVRRTKAR